MRLAVATQPRTLGAAYERCRQLHARHGRTYYLATLLLPRWKRRHVHALYGFTRYADEIVDDLDSTLDRAGQAAALRAWGERFFAGLRGQPCQDPILPAVLHTVRAFDLDVADFERFLHSMAMDLHTDGYRTYDDLCRLHGGLGGRDRDHDGPDPGVRRPAGRRRSTPASSAWPSSSPTSSATSARTQSAAGSTCRRPTWSGSGSAGPTWPPPRPPRPSGELLAFETERARAHYRAAEPGIELLVPSSRPCVRVAFDLYGGILDEVERAGYQVLARRVAVPRHRRLGVAGRHLIAARAAARAERRVSVATPGR